jgi:hypothetical protein
MNYNALIEKIMHETQNGSNEPFLVFRENDEWLFDLKKDRSDGQPAWGVDVEDPFVISFNGSDFKDWEYNEVYGHTNKNTSSSMSFRSH